jgi:hypothetical protein
MILIGKFVVCGGKTLTLLLFQLRVADIELGPPLSHGGAPMKMF